MVKFLTSSTFQGAALIKGGTCYLPLRGNTVCRYYKNIRRKCCFYYVVVYDEKDKRKIRRFVNWWV